MSIDNRNFESYIPVYDTIPEKWEDGRAFLIEQLKKIINSLNVREIGFFLDEELVSGKLFIPGQIPPGTNPNTNFRTVFRKVIDFGPLTVIGINSRPHGITFDVNFTLIELRAEATKPTATFSAIPIPFVSQTENAEIEINMDATNVNIVTAIDYSAYTRVFVIIEYLLEQ